MNVEQTLKFLVAGQAVFTLRSRVTQNHYTYRIMKKSVNGRPDIFFASVLRGSDEWTYMGVYEPYAHPQPGGVVRQSQGSKVSADAPSFQGLNWFLRHLESPRVEFMHVGKCGRCGRPLTNPESIESGLGPECAGRVGARRKGPRPVTPASVQNPLPGFERSERPSEIRGLKPELLQSANSCCEALDRALEPPREPNLVVPLLLSLLKEADVPK